MAATMPSLKAAIISLVSMCGNVTDADKLDCMAGALATAIVDEIHNATVTIPGGSSAGTYPVD